MARRQSGTGLQDNRRRISGFLGGPAATYSFFQPSTSGPASSAGYTGAFAVGINFQVTKACTLLAYWFWPAIGGDTVAKKFALWVMTGVEIGTLVSGSVVTSGVMTLGQWNEVALGTGVALSPGNIYQAQVAWEAVHGFSITTNQFGSGDPFAGGIQNGPLDAYSDTSGTNPVPIATVQQAPETTAWSDPTTNPVPFGFQSSNWWIDITVQ